MKDIINEYGSFILEALIITMFIKGANYLINNIII